MSKSKFFLRSTQSRIGPASRSLSQADFSKVLPKSKVLEKEFDTIGEEATVQSIQSPVLKRDKSADHARTFAEYPEKVLEMYKGRISQLEFDLANIRGEFLRLIEEKVKLEKELMENKKKNRDLMEKNSQFEEVKKNCHVAEGKYKESREKVVVLNRKLSELYEKTQLDYEESNKIQRGYEDRIQKLIKENVVYKSELHFRDEFCGKLHQEIADLKSMPKDHYEKAAVKNLSYIILSKEGKTDLDPKAKLKELEIEFEKVKHENFENILKRKELEEWMRFVCTQVKSRNFSVVSEFIEGKSLLSEKSFAGSSKNSIDSQEITEINQHPRVKELEKLIETLEIKLELQHTTSEFINYMQCQAVIIENYLNEDTEVSLINSSMFSF